MRKGQRDSIFGMLGAVAALQLLVPQASLATDGGDPVELAERAAEDRWIPSFAITGGTTIEQQQGSADSFFIEEMPPSSCTPSDTSAQCRSLLLGGPFDGDDLGVSPFVGGSLELMTPALPIPTRPRLFLSGEFLPTFANDRSLAVDGEPDCVRSPLPDSPCARDDDGTSPRTFAEESANGTGTRTTARVDRYVFGANIGMAFPVQVGKRQLRIKPSIGWINYKVEAEGFVVGAACDPTDRCTTTTILERNFIPPPEFIERITPGFLRETILSAEAAKRFNGIGPGLDIEMDTGRYGPIGSSIFLGGRAYQILGDRTISFSSRESFDDVFGMDTAVGNFEVEVDPWMFRVHLGIRFQWLGSGN